MFVFLRDDLFFFNSISDCPKDRDSTIVDDDFRESAGIDLRHFVHSAGFCE